MKSSRFCTLPSVHCFVFAAFIFGTLFVSALANGHDLEKDKPKLPNVVFFLADDLGCRDLSNEGSTFYESPHIDRIANEGMKFTRGYATCQVCSPSRASIMTGKYPARLNITDWIGADMGDGWKRNTRLLPALYEHNLPHDDVTIAEAFRDAGYKTFFAGKWHLGNEGSWPDDHGFEINKGGHHRGSPPGGYFSPYNNPALEDGPKGELLPVRLGKECAKFIEENQDEPFFAYVAFYSVHGPIQSTKKLWMKYRDKAEKQGLPEARFIVDRTSPVRQVQDNPLYAGMVESMDDGVGVVLDTLDRLNLADNTIVVFTSDNGGVSAGDGKATSNLPFRGGKGRQWEGGIREPYYIKWPHSEAGGKLCSTPATGTDFYPTLLEMCGLDPRPNQHVDGVSLVPLFKGEKIQERSLFWHYPHYGNQGGDPSSIVMQGDWKLINYHESGRNELYNVHEDIGERNDISELHRQRTAEMLKQLDQWLVSVDAKLPTSNPRFDMAKYRQQQLKTLTNGVQNLEKQQADMHRSDYKPRQGWWEETGK